MLVWKEPFILLTRLKNAGLLTYEDPEKIQFGTT